MEDLFKKIYSNKGDIGKWASLAEGYFVFPKLEGPISNRMKFNGKEIITWSVNDYLGLASHPEIRDIDAKAAKEYGSAYPMGARMMSGHTRLHEELETKLSDFVCSSPHLFSRQVKEDMCKMCAITTEHTKSFLWGVRAYKCYETGYTG